MTLMLDGASPEFDLFSWVEKQDPATMPYRPNTPHTQGFGLRIAYAAIALGASPAHVGNDRGAEPSAIYMPYSGGIIWQRTNQITGSLLQIIPADNSPVEIQVFHTLPATLPSADQRIIHRYERGDKTEFQAGSLGISVGSHTHTEFITPFSEKTFSVLKTQAQPIYTQGRVSYDHVREHCNVYRMDYEDFLRRLLNQIELWGIEELWSTFAVRSELPHYRVPHWGKGKTIHLCTRTFLQI